MIRNLLIYVSVFVVSCSEPFEIDKKSEIIVVEGQISNLISRSFIRIYRLNEEGNITSFPDLVVNVMTESGDEFAFRTSKGSNLYLPAAGFTGVVGERYRMEARGPEDLFFESTYDMLVEPIEFELNTKDTTIAILNSLNIINFSQGTAVIAEIPSQENSIFSRMDFKYSYIDYFTEKTVEVQTEDEFVLYSCDDDVSCLTSTNIPVGSTTRHEWFFLLNTQACGSAADTLNLLENCNATSCCQYFEDWPAEFEIRVESMSQESYEFWAEVVRLRQNNGLIFDTYPFPISGNISCENCDKEVVGIFRTVSETFEKKTVIL
ncbi:DUF4249 family protein [Ekhidna sp.]